MTPAAHLRFRAVFAALLLGAVAGRAHTVVFPVQAIQAAWELPAEAFRQKYPGVNFTGFGLGDEGWYVRYRHENLTYFFGPIENQTQAREHQGTMDALRAELLTRRPALESSIVDIVHFAYTNTLVDGGGADGLEVGEDELGLAAVLVDGSEAGEGQDQEKGEGDGEGQEQKGGKAGKGERGERNERGTVAAASSQAGQAGQAGRASRSARAQARQQGQAQQAGMGQGGEAGPQQVQLVQLAQLAQLGQMPQPGQPSQPGQPGQPGQAGQSGSPGAPSPPGSPTQSSTSSQQGQPSQQGSPTQAGQPGQPSPSGQPGSPGAPPSEPKRDGFDLVGFIRGLFGF